MQRESSAPTLPMIHQFYIGTDDNRIITQNIYNSTNLPINITDNINKDIKHVSTVSDEPVKPIHIHYCKEKPSRLHSQPIVTDLHALATTTTTPPSPPSPPQPQPPPPPTTTTTEHASAAASCDKEIPLTASNQSYLPGQMNRLSRNIDENIPLPNDDDDDNDGNIQCHIVEKEPYSITEDFLREPIPNGGWGWLVALGSFLCIFTVDGVCFSYGLHINEMIKEGQFSGNPPLPLPPPAYRVNDTTSQISLAMLSLPGALLCGVYFLFGPLTGALVNRFDYRIVASVGSIITTLCFLICALFIHDIFTFNIVFGIIGGIGCSLIYLPAITVIGHWFEEHRAFIVGMVMCGGCLGFGLLSIITPYLAEHFTWRGCLILLAGLFSQTLVGIALFRPVSVHEKIKLVKLLKQSEIKKKVNLVKKSKCKKHKSLTTSFGMKSAKVGGRPDKKIAIQRGSIMARIIEEKSRQRTTSTGSLDGMVITRENQLVALSSSDAYEVVMAAAAVYSATTAAHTTTAGMLNTQRDEGEDEEGRHQGKQSGEAVEDDTETRGKLEDEEEMNTSQPLTTTQNQSQGDHGSLSLHSSSSGQLKYISNNNNNRKNLQTLTEGFPMSSFEEATCEFHRNSQPACVAVLPPPVQFSRSAVRRIARAILRKLHGQNKLPFSPSTTSISTSSRQVITTTSNRNSSTTTGIGGGVGGGGGSAGGDSRVESCTNFNNIPYTDSSKNIQYDKLNQVYRYELLHGSLATNISRRKRSLLISSLYSELSSSIRDNETLTDLQQQLQQQQNQQQQQRIQPRHLSITVNRSISPQDSQSRLKPPTSDSPSALTSLISLDSYTSQIIARELNSLLLDKDTKLAIMHDIQRELSRPKYRPDFFYAGNKHKLPLCHVPEYTACKQFPCDTNHALLKDLKYNQIRLAQSTSKRYPILLQEGLVGGGGGAVSGGSLSIDDSSGGCGGGDGVIGYSVMNKSVKIMDHHHHHPHHHRRHHLLNRHHHQHQQQHGTMKHLTDVKNLIDAPRTNELLAYLIDMLDCRILKSFTFILLSIACFVNMFVLLVPFYYLPILLAYGGVECHINSVWCPTGLTDGNITHRNRVDNTMNNSLLHQLLEYINTFDKNYSFVSTELLLFTISCASILGRLFAGLYIEKGLNTNRKLLRQCPRLVDPMLLNNVALILCGLSVIAFPLAIHGIVQTPPSERFPSASPSSSPSSSSHRALQIWTLKFRRQLLYFGGILYGLATAMSISLRSVLLVELFGLRRLTNAFGYLLIFQGLGVICGPPLFGVVELSRYRGQVMNHS
ncbi:unnamed protein product [Trichobilharzia szidati]|nr:unnamed protein product [Trichobilharzia szidati]